MTERITSASNPRVKRLTALGRKAKLRREERVFIIEGERLYTDTPRKYLKEIYMIGARQLHDRHAGDHAEDL